MSTQPLMGDLPPVRISQIKPFSEVGVDYGGPFLITLSKSRGCKSQKAYIALFICMATKAIHLELVSDLTTDAFLAALRRFISRRGRCLRIHSDCGTNFVGAARELQNFMSQAAESLTIEWHFNPPHAPHFGGLWVAGIKAVKSHLVRTVGDQVLTFEELSTVLAQVEAILNSRPLCPQSSDPNDLLALTPGHFLCLDTLTLFPEPNLLDLNVNRLSRWQLVQRLHQHLWRRWHDEYLNSLMQRAKWTDPSIPIVVGTMVLLKEENSPPLKWHLARVLEVHPGKDGITRVVKKPSSTIRFFNRSDYYTCHGSDAKFVAECTNKLLKYMGEQPKLSYVCLSKNVFEAFVRDLLLVKQYRVEVYIKSSESKNNDWLLQFKGSPGNLSQFEDLLFENANIPFNNVVMGVQFGAKVTAIACVNITEVKIEVCEISDNECFTELEAIIAQVGPKECVIPSGDSLDLRSLQKVLERNGILVAKAKKSDFSPDDIVQDLNHLLFFHEGQQRSADAIPETKFQDAMGSLQALIRFLNLTADEQNFNQYKISQFGTHRFVRLDSAALYALSVLPEGGENPFESSVLLPTASKSYCLLGILNSCVTSQGKRLLERWIKQPLKDYNLINERLDIVEYLVNDTEAREGIRKDSLTRMPDFMFLSKKLSAKKANLQDLYKVYQAICAIPSLIRMLRKVENNCVQAVLIDPISEIVSDMEKYQDMIEHTIDMDFVERGEFLVKSSYDEELAELANKKESLEEKMQKVLKQASNDLGFDDAKSLKLECNDQHGYYFRVTLKDERALRTRKDYKIIEAVKGGVKFTNSKLQSINELYINVKSDYEDKQKHIVKEIVDVAQGYAESLRSLNVLLATIDVLATFANVAVNGKSPCIRPKLHPSNHGVLKLKKARHICLEQQDHINFIPNDIEFDQNDKTLFVVTGPNMCGKSTFIRSVGLCVLMAHIGCWVPCEEAEISLVDAILARVGADDCHLKGLSTFMLEMIETSTIIKAATQNSLVIIDELGRGTSTYDGCGIAWAIAEYLVEKTNSFTLFATHFHEITQLTERFQSAGNLHVTAITTSNTITPLYQVRLGECDKSYGIHCARLAEFPEDIIQWANEHQKVLEHQQGMKLISNFEPPLKRRIIDNGDSIINSTLEHFKGLDIKNMSDEDLEKIANETRSKLMESQNLFINGLLAP